MIRKSAAIATIVVVIIVIAISITKANAQVMRVEALDCENAGTVVFDVDKLCSVGGVSVKNVVAQVASDMDVRTEVEEMDVRAEVRAVANLVAVNGVSLVTVDSSVACEDLSVCVRGV